MTFEEELRRLLGSNLADEVMLILLGRMAPVEFPERDVNGRAGIMLSLGPDDPTPTEMAIVNLGAGGMRLGMPKRYRNGVEID